MSPSLKRRVLFLVIFTVFLDLVGFGIVIPLLPIYVKKMNASEITAGIILSCFSVSQLVATPLLGRLSDKHGRRKIILLSLGGNALSMIVFAVATNIRLLPLLFASRILAGATAGNLSACQAAIADVTTRQERSAEMARLGAGIGLGMVVGPFLGGWLSSYGDWAPPIGAASMAVIDLVLTFALMPETRWKGAASATALAQEEAAEATAETVAAAGPMGPLAPSAPAPAAEAAERQSPPKPTVLEALRGRRMASVLVLYFLTFLCLTNIQLSFGFLAKDRMHWTEREISNSFGLFGFTGLVIQGAFFGRLVKAVGEINLVLAGALLNMTAMICIGLAERPPMLIAGLVIFAVGLAITNPSLSSLASMLARDEQQGAVLGFAQSAGGLARTIGPTWSGFLYTQLGSVAPFISGAVASFLSLLVGFSVKIAGPDRTGDEPTEPAYSPAQKPDPGA